jgi:hypothetical protein
MLIISTIAAATLATVPLIMSKPSEVRFPGITRHAKTLRVHPNHLRLVIQGRRESPELLAKYNALIEHDPEGALGLKPAFCPAGTSFEPVDNAMRKTARQEFGPDGVRFEGNAMILLRDAVMMIAPQIAPVDTAAASQPSSASGDPGNADKSTHQPAATPDR